MVCPTFVPCHLAKLPCGCSHQRLPVGSRRPWYVHDRLPWNRRWSLSVFLIIEVVPRCASIENTTLASHASSPLRSNRMPLFFGLRHILRGATLIPLSARDRSFSSMAMHNSSVLVWLSVAGFFPSGNHCVGWVWRESLRLPGVLDDTSKIVSDSFGRMYPSAYSFMMLLQSGFGQIRRVFPHSHLTAQMPVFALRQGLPVCAALRNPPLDVLLYTYLLTAIGHFHTRKIRYEAFCALPRHITCADFFKDGHRTANSFSCVAKVRHVMSIPAFYQFPFDTI